MTLEEDILSVIKGPHVAAVATIADGLPAVRFMVLTGFEDMTLVGGTMRDSRKVQQLKQDVHVAIAIWSGKEYSDPYVVMRGLGEVIEEPEKKKKYWNPLFEQYFKRVDNPDYVVVHFTAEEIEYTDPRKMAMDIWKRSSDYSYLH